jgi:hypothetical protein
VRGAFTRDGRTTPAATRLEGLVAALSFLREDGSDLRKKVRRAIDRGTAFVLSTQVKSGDHAGAVPRAAGKLSKSHRDYSKSFNRQATEVRIDYVQHALSAFIGYEAIATGTPAPKPTP